MSGCNHRVAAVTAASHEVRLPFRVLVCGARSKLSGSPAPASTSAVSSPARAVFRVPPSPVPSARCGVESRTAPEGVDLVGAGSSSRRLTSSSEFQPIQPARHAHMASTSPGVSDSIATSSERVHLVANFPRPAYVPSLAFRALPTAYSSLTLAGLFHPAATSEFSSSGVFPANQRTGLSPAPALLSFSCVRLRPSMLVRANSRSPTPGLCSDCRSVTHCRPVKVGLDPIPS